MFKFIAKNLSSVRKIDTLDNINSYLKESLEKLKISNLSNVQNDIYQSIQNDSPTMLLCDEYCGRKYGTILGIVNRVLENPCNYINEEGFYKVPRDTYELNVKNSEFNKQKRDIKPHGVVLICHKFDFLTHYYKITRRLDYMNRLRVVRLGNSLQSVAPSVENQDTSSSSEDRDDMLDNIKIGLINATEWKKVDILFASLSMMDLVVSNKENYDSYDINPEIVIIDDFDYILK
jgi:hypothetical protein